VGWSHRVVVTEVTVRRRGLSGVSLEQKAEIEEIGHSL
jgi:hypothetical protein